MLADLIRLIRPRHWVKNVFVLMPVPFALATGGAIDPPRFAAGLAGMCLAASAVYAFNDVRDAERDRLHPEKRRRPVASGAVPESFALLLSLALAGGAVALAYWAGATGAGATVAAYLALNLVYCVRGKEIPLLDVFLLASGFVLRVVLGCVLAGVHASNWLLLCSSTLALFLALAKRRADIVAGLDSSHRPSLAGYTREYLDQAMGIMAGMCILAYALYCLEADVLLQGREFASLPFVIFGVLDYLRLAYVRGEGGSPGDTLFRSPSLVMCGVGWGAGVLFSLGMPG